ncbi:universal stress protein UspA [Pseudomonas sp. R-28-1W-6]|uniref:universal stress protein n=1 Tax=Pseudomonas sp. R-28-1W-6 TaxID=2650101 RepID=UPI0013654DB8|nr:universal stress protein [Pseudomonas sp. R-28-1W-6]MWV12391.1 universal stress protein UspA [Pseudomonas sp. R-28-1W-6]
MRSIHKILVAIPPELDSPALQRGQQLARALGAELHLLACGQHQDHSELLDRQLASLHGQGLRASGEQTRVAIHQLCDTILATCRAQNCDLVIKQYQPDTLLSKLLSPPDDWQLVRQLPVPLLLVRNPRPWTGSTVLAAMDVARQDAAHIALQGNVIDHASELCQLFGARLHVVSAYDPMLPQADPSVPIDHTDATHCHDQCQWFQDEYELSEQQLHISEGPAKALIPRIARQLEAAVIVLGTVARHGLSGLLMGNTAEAVLDHLDCDVLILKPHTPEPQEAASAGQRAA